MTDNEQLRTEDEIQDILTCACECPQPPINVERVEMLVEECLKLRKRLVPDDRYDYVRTLVAENEKLRAELDRFKDAPSKDDIEMYLITEDLAMKEPGPVPGFYKNVILWLQRLAEAPSK